MTVKEKLVELFKDSTLENKTIKQIFNYFGIKAAFEKDTLRQALDELEDEGIIAYNGGKYYLFENSGLKRGTLKCHERGFAFFIPEKSGEDYFIPAKKLNGAMQGDTVLVRRCESKRGSTDEAEVVKIVKRGKVELVGTYYAERTFGFVVPDDKGFSKDIFILPKNSLNAKNGNKVLCKIISYSNGKSPEGVILEIVGKKSTLETEELSVIIESGIDTEFNQEALEQAENISDCVLPREKEGRLDLTDKLIITIDGDDSRDFDDAISLETNERGSYLLGVHIADVSHYVKEGSAIDKQALSRATSVYFPDRVIPMLPEKLSNGICSLNEGVERLTLSCLMEVSSAGEVVNYEFASTVIRSSNRMTYKTVQKIIDGDEQLREKYSHLTQMIDNCYKLAQILYAKRKKEGSVDIESKESTIFVENGKITLEKKERAWSNQLIEEFMLLANVTVARHCFYLDIPFVYRIHEKPTEEKIAQFCAFIKGLGIKTTWNEKNYHPHDFNVLLEKVKDESYSGVVNSVLLRSMQKAKYSPNDIGHFGLSFDHYCHFTSPIRRYPDLAVHRILKTVIADYERAGKYAGVVEEVSEVSSRQERVADDVERKIDDLYKCAYMRDYIGEEFEGIISGVTSFGVFVELENSAEGLIRLENLPAGSYYFDEQRFCLFSEKAQYKLGDKIKIVVANCDILTREIDFVLAK